ncbi:MAG TPA: hypothetical protein VF363_05750 [Candidatus Eisenbacteria bacterium]
MSREDGGGRVTRLRALALPILAALVFPLALARVSGFFTDDSYIHLVFARNLVSGHGFSFNPGEPVYGFTSPLWVFLLAGADRIGFDWLVGARVLGLVFTLLAVAATFRLARAAGGSTGASFAAAASLGFHAWFLRWSLSGMETSLAAFLAACGLERLLSGGRAAAAGLLALALGVLARPEMALLFAIGIGWSLARARGDGRAGARAAAWGGAALGVALLAGWGLTVHAATGAWIPTAYTAKRVHEAITAEAAAQGIAYTLAVILITDALLLVAAFAGAARAARARDEEERRGPAGALSLLVLWPLALLAFYLIARVQMISRYWVPAAPALCVAAWVGAEQALRPRARTTLGVLYFAQQAAVLLFLVAPQIDAFTRGLGQGPVAIGRWLRANAADTALIATPDIGAIGFYGRRRVLDLGGLVTPAMAPILAGRDIDEIEGGALYEAVGHPDYLVGRALRPMALAGPRYVPLLTSRIDNLGISRPGPRWYTLYRVVRDSTVATPPGSR